MEAVEGQRRQQWRRAALRTPTARSVTQPLRLLGSLPRLLCAVFAGSQDTALTLRPLRNTSRVFKNKVAQEIVDYER